MEAGLVLIELVIFLQLNIVVLSILAVKIWTLYCQFMMDIMEGQHSIEGVRSTFEKAIIAAGLHVTEVQYTKTFLHFFQLQVIVLFYSMN